MLYLQFGSEPGREPLSAWLCLLQGWQGARTFATVDPAVVPSGLSWEMSLMALCGGVGVVLLHLPGSRNWSLGKG